MRSSSDSNNGGSACACVRAILFSLPITRTAHYNSRRHRANPWSAHIQHRVAPPFIFLSLPSTLHQSIAKTISRSRLLAPCRLNCSPGPTLIIHTQTHVHTHTQATNLQNNNCTPPAPPLVLPFSSPTLSLMQFNSNGFYWRGDSSECRSSVQLHKRARRAFTRQSATFSPLLQAALAPVPCSCHHTFAHIQKKKIQFLP